MTPVTYAAAALEIGLALGGAGLLWRLVLSPAARARRAPSPLAPWTVPPSDFLLFLLHALLGGLGGSVLAGVLARAAGFAGDPLAMVSTAGLHFGILGGVMLFHGSRRDGGGGGNPGPAREIFLSGVATFLIALPIVMMTGFAWAGVLTLAGKPVERQPAVELFLRLKSPAWIAFMTVTAGIVAPITEELVFRRGFFRFLRTRIPHGMAVVLPALLFSASHVDVNTFGQLAVLGIVFSLAYERTGTIGTTMVAHALFNLNAVLLLLVGIEV